MLKDKITSETVESCKEDIKNKQDEIKKKDEELTKIYFQLREILENTKNHKDNLICRPLLEDKEREYKNLLNGYKRKYFIYQDDKKRLNKEIEGKYEEIKTIQKDNLSAEQDKETQEIQEFENKRRNNLDKIIGFIKGKEDYKEILKRVQDIMNG